MKLLFSLYLTYLKISFASFGGISMIPLLSREMLSHGWMTETEVGDIVAIAEMTPGPLALNCASFVGMRVAGVWGSLFANLGVLTPSLTLGILAALFFDKFKNSKVFDYALSGIRPVSLGMILATILSLCASNYFLNNQLSICAIIIGLISFMLLLVKKCPIPMAILIAGILGILLRP